MTEIAVEDQAPSTPKLLSEVKEGLTRAGQKRLPTMLLYDERGSQLFDAICDLPEYYPTRTELGLMQSHVGEMADVLGPECLLVEPGSGSSLKTRLLLHSLHDMVGYVPLDISNYYLETASAALHQDFPTLEILPVCADFTKPFEIPAPRVAPRRRVIYFPGSTIGNFALREAQQLMQNFADVTGPDGALLIGADLRKDLSILLPAYNDSEGITAQFNLNALVHCNNVLGTNFDVDNFRHEAIYDETFHRIEMHLESLVDQYVRVDDSLTVEIKKGETICTEYSHKWSTEGFSNLAGQAGWSHRKVWVDENNLFSIHYLAVAKK